LYNNNNNKVHLYLTSAIFESINSELKSLSIEALIFINSQCIDATNAITNINNSTLHISNVIGVIMDLHQRSGFIITMGLICFFISKDTAHFQKTEYAL